MSRSRVMTIIGLLIACLLLSGSIIAQDDSPQYRLHVPNATEYLEAIPEVVRQWSNTSLPSWSKGYPTPLYDTIIEELYYRYPLEDILDHDYDLLFNAYNGLELERGALHSPDHVEDWRMGLIRARFQDEHYDLDAINHLEFGGFSIDVIPRDFNGDGQNEYLLKITGGSPGRFYQWIVFTTDSSLPEGYREIPTEIPVFWWDFYHDLWQHEEVFFEDINADGLPEWGVAVAGESYSTNGLFMILAWRDDALVQINDGNTNFSYPSQFSGIVPPNVSFSIENIDDDTAMEFVQAYYLDDNWGCRQYLKTTFNWVEQAERYIAPDTSYSYDDSMNCMVRFAEPLMWNADYAPAAQLYDDALQYPYADTAREDAESELIQYINLRLILAYAMSGQHDKAYDVYSRLSDGFVDQSVVMAGLFEAIDASGYLQDNNNLNLCTYYFNYINDFHLYNYRNLETKLNLGFVVDGFYLPPMGTSLPEADKAGCNIELVFERAISRDWFVSATLTPVERLQRDFDIAIEQSLQFDGNNDELQDWLIWPEATVSPILMLSDADSGLYIISRPAIPRSNNVIEIDVVALPDESVAIASLGFDPDPEFSGSGSPTYDLPHLRCLKKGEFTDQRGQLVLWQFQDKTAVQLQDIPMCEQHALNDFFPETPTTQFEAWSSSINSCDVIVTATYTWDFVMQEYVPSVVCNPDEGLSTTPEPGSMYGPVGIMLFRYEDSRDLFWESPEKSLASVDAELAGLREGTDLRLVYGFYYWRALMLEVLDRPDEALAQYIEIYETAPDSAWGMLAALHIEQID